MAYLSDGRIIQVLTDGGEGFFRQQTIVGKDKTISTHECFIANGRWKRIDFFNKEVSMSTEEPEVPEEEEEDDD